jgi:putative hydrolase of the HAD superfamily
MRQRAVFFDLAGTLIEVRGGLGVHYAAIAREFGVDADPQAIDSVFPQAFESAGEVLFPDPDPAEVASLEKQFWKRVVREVFALTGGVGRFHGAAFDSYFDRLFDYFATADGWLVFPDVVPSLTRLRDSGLVVGLITNFDLRIFPLLDALGLAPLFDSITIPALARACKPQPEIFDYALARHGLRAPEAVFVGDSMADDVEGAMNAGLVPVLIDRRGLTQALTATQIRSLEEIADRLSLKRGRG